MTTGQVEEHAVRKAAMEAAIRTGMADRAFIGYPCSLAALTEALQEEASAQHVSGPAFSTFAKTFSDGYWAFWEGYMGTRTEVEE